MVTRRPNVVIVISLVLAGAILAIAIWVLAQMRDDALRRAQDSALNVSLLVERDVSRNLETLRSVAACGHRRAANSLAWWTLPPAIRQMVLFDGAASAKDMGSMLVLDQAGNVIFDSQSATPRQINLADRDYFRVHRNSPDVGLYVSRPLHVEVRPAPDMSIALSRRLSHPDGSFAGVVVGTLRLTYFRRLFAGMNLGNSWLDGADAERRHDADAASVRPENHRHQSDRHAPTTRASPSGQRRFLRHGGHRRRGALVRFPPYRRFPLLLDVAISTRDIYAGWRHRAWIIGS